MTPGRLALLAATLALATVPLLAGCGGDDESASEEWAGGVCSELSTWVTDVEALVDRETVQDAVGDISQSTDDLVEGLGDLGRPETDAGEEAQSELDDLEAELRQQLGEVEESVESGPLAIGTLTSAISTAAAAVNATFENLSGVDDELRAAFESSDDCQSFRDQLERTETG